MIAKLIKENAGRKATDQDFALALELGFWIDRGFNVVVFANNKIEREASDVEISLWDQLRHAYGFEARGTCNSLHEAQLDAEENVRTGTVAPSFDDLYL